ncbi:MULTISPECIES: hypothetical protein [Aerococcus]|uniref:Uncharacterized protein n=1 Tax=Aerococcus sanguinicola TaxID=119206 RepID=A0A5N1GLC4_9LACT|nr:MULTISPECIES: hypothetical protein [Aerococcus]KAA9300851.1 hypothetical protein F6I03_05975 [Aerococcus sanguinicola]MDK6369081.1 hypothetical protein [Aerococcus sp. UMB9870]MDK6686574.1 hypothetical protein [Aerococcus sp. UMB8623]MDK6939782.1 hypothetical protein [Aerococcus sp. UMB8487]OFK17432.1 hypothetical protein HMPREF2829_08295 [Aerococcus sp. HMSC072A12]
MVRSGKHFTDYNAYHDRGFQLKWRTAFALDELVQSIEGNIEEDQKKNPKEAQMSPEAISAVLYEAYFYHRPLEVQLNRYDHLGRLWDKRQAYFNGCWNASGLWLGEDFYPWEAIRHLRILPASKWSK